MNKYVKLLSKRNEALEYYELDKTHRSMTDPELVDSKNAYEKAEKALQKYISQYRKKIAKKLLEGFPSKRIKRDYKEAE